MFRSEEDLQLLSELAGVLDQTVAEGGLTSGTYLVLRQLAATDEEVPVGTLAAHLGGDPTEVADLAGRLAADGLVEVRGGGLLATEAGGVRAREIETAANEAMRVYMLERPHTATVYGLVASMQSGRFTVEDLLAFLTEGPTET